MSRAADAAAGIPWLITEDALTQILAIAERENLDPAAARQLRAERETAAATLAIGGTRLKGTRSVTVRDGVAVVPIIGPVFRYANLFTELSGATSLDELAQEFAVAAAAADVSTIVLQMDTPGGQATGIAEFAAAVRAVRDQGDKRIVAYVGDLAASAGYWIASAAGEIVLSPTGVVGSIGACMAVTDRSMADAAQGRRRLDFVSSRAPRKNASPDTPQGRQDIQAALDAIEEQFIAAVAANRDVSVEKVAADFGQGGIVPRTEDAIRAGMADRVGSLDTLIRDLAGATPQRAPANRAAKAAAAISEDPSMESKPTTMTPAELAVAHPDAVAQIRASAVSALTLDAVKAGHPTIADALRADGAAAAVTAERERIASISKRTLPSHEKLRDAAIAEGTSYAAFLDAQTAAEQQKGEKVLSQLRTGEENMPKVDAQPTAAGQPQPQPGANKDAPIDERAKAEWDKSADVRAEFNDDFKSYVAFRRADDEGRVRRLARS